MLSARLLAVPLAYGKYSPFQFSAQIRDNALSSEALAKGMAVKSVEFVKQGAEVYHKV